MEEEKDGIKELYPDELKRILKANEVPEEKLEEIIDMLTFSLVAYL